MFDSAILTCESQLSTHVHRGAAVVFRQFLEAAAILAELRLLAYH